MPFQTRREWIAKVLKVLAGIGLLRFSVICEKSRASIDIIPHTKTPTSIGEAFVNEVMNFTVGFLFFRHAGDAQIGLVPLPQRGRYRATLSGKTRGIIGFLTRHRQDIHISELEEDKSRKRFICTRLIRDTKIGNNHTIKIFEMDYKKRRLTITRIKGKRKSLHSKPIPKGDIYDDPVTAFYNFRFGSYGPIRYGKKFVINTIPGKRLNHITLQIGSKQETKRKARALTISGRVKYLVYLWIAPDIIKSKKGEIEGWLSPTLIPLYGVAKDVILFGDVEGKLIRCERVFKPPPPL